MLIKPYNEGIELVVNKIITAENKPFVISVSGSPNSGKTHFRKDIKERLEKLGIFGWSCVEGTDKDSVALYTVTQPQYVTIEDTDYSKHLNDYSKEIIGKGTDFSVFMCKQLTKFEFDYIDLSKKVHGKNVFDLAIYNSDANGRYKGNN